MKRSIKTILFSLVSLLGFAQDEVKLPNFTPPSPEASAMTKYADLQANEFKGMIGHTIPLYNYKAGQLEVPISITYNGSGVRVDDIPSWVGINWTLNAGGVITRTIRDIADETTGLDKRRIFSDSDVAYYNLNTIDGTNEANYIWETFTNSQYDTEVDIFQFNFNGYSGSFYLDENWQAQLIRDDQNLKINIGSKSDFNNSKIIEIYDSNGVKYTFGGISAIEETSLRNTFNGGGYSETYEGVTAFYLTKIEHPIQGEIFFVYETLSSQILSVQKTQKKTRVVAHYDQVYCESGVLRCENDRNVENVTTSFINVSSRVINPRYLKNIYSINNSEEINFNSENVDNQSFKRVLNSIKVDKDGLGPLEPFKTIDFDYYGFSANPHPFATTKYAQNRFFLTEITFDKDVDYAVNTQSGRRNQVYKFEYNSPGSLPNRFSYSQDFLGYFNGKSNTTGIPNHPTFNPFGTENVADRSPNFSSAICGTLKRIHYPTGGYTEFDYEPASKAKKKIYKSISLHAWRNMAQYNFLSNNHLSDGIPQAPPAEYEGPAIGIFDVYESQDVNINVILKAYREQGDVILNQNERATLVVTRVNPTTLQEVVVKSQLLTMNSDSSSLTQLEIAQKSFTISVSFIEGYDYKVNISINPTTSNDPIGMEALVGLSYNDGYTIENNLGVRLKRMTDYSKDSQPENIKRYYYSEIEKINAPIDLETLPILGEEGGYIKEDKHIFNEQCSVNALCPPNTSLGAVEIWYQYLNIYSDRFIYGESEGSDKYENVSISLGGDNFERGGIEKTFDAFSNYGVIEIRTLTNNIPLSSTSSLIDANNEFLNKFNSISSPYNGTLVKERYFKSENQNLKKIREVEYNYQYTISNKINNVISHKEFEPFWFEPGETPSNVASYFTLGVYSTESKRGELIQKQTIEYIDPVPLGVLDESTYRKITSSEDYLYGALRGMPTHITSSTSQNSVTNLVKNYYTNQINQLSGFTPDQIASVNTLENKFIISKPIQTEQYQNSEKLMSIRTLYKNIGTNVNFPKIVPDIIQAKKGEIANLPFEDRVRYLEYDNSGRPTLISLEKGTKTKYFYNSKNQVTMKIENYVAGAGGMLPENIDSTPVAAPCVYLDSSGNPLPILVTIYKYDPDTDLLTEIIDPKCDHLHYIYDDLHRLKYIKDKTGNILQEFDSSFKRY